MPARVEFRLGSIFDEPCDLLVIPSSARGAVSPNVHTEIREAGLQFPPEIPWGLIRVFKSENPRYGAIAYAAGVAGERSSSLVIEEIGRKLGRICQSKDSVKVSAPLLGAGSGNLAPQDSVAALAGGFQEAAPEDAVLVISVRRPEVYNALTGKTLRVIRTNRDLLRERLMTTAGAAPYLVDPPRAGSSPAAKPPPESPPWSARRGVFISYSHADAEWLERLQKHLKPLQREGVDVWDDTRLRPGEHWREKIREALAAAKVAILLVSPDFLNSEFIATDELPPLLMAAEEDGATILPVIVSHCRFDRTPSLSRFQAVNDPAKPLVRMGRGNRDKVFDDVARAVEDALGK